MCSPWSPPGWTYAVPYSSVFLAAQPPARVWREYPKRAVGPVVRTVVLGLHARSRPSILRDFGRPVVSDPSATPDWCRHQARNTRASVGPAVGGGVSAPVRSGPEGGRFSSG